MENGDDQVAKSKIASLVADVFSNTQVAENKVPITLTWALYLRIIIIPDIVELRYKQEGGGKLVKLDDED